MTLRIGGNAKMDQDRWRPTLLVYDPLKAGSIDGTDQFAHDRAILRALNAKYKPNKELRSDPECTIFVGRLSKNTIEQDLEVFFKKFGEIIAVHLVRDIVTGFSKCYAFIEFAEKRDARDAQRANGATIDEKQVLVEMECGRTLKNWKPRRLGGGFSGRKESGQLRFGGNQRPFRRPYSQLMQSRKILREEFGTPIADNTGPSRPTPMEARNEPRRDIEPPASFDGGPRHFPVHDPNRYAERTDRSQSRDRNPNRAYSQPRQQSQVRGMSVPLRYGSIPRATPERYHPPPPRQSMERDPSLHRDEQQSRRSQSREISQSRSRDSGRDERFEEGYRDSGGRSRERSSSGSRHSQNRDSYDDGKSRERSHSRDGSRSREHRRSEDRYSRERR